jgi:hypothetical protein
VEALMAKRLAFSFALLAAFGLTLLISSPVDTYGQAKTPKDVTVLKGSPLGGVKLDHKKHSEVYTAKKCETCHHASKPEKANTSPQQSCQECHTKTVAAPMKTNTAAAFHKTAMATGGTCIDCHKAENAKGKAAPVKCVDCHKKENT